MKINCQERYNEALAYAETLGDSTLKECLDKLKRWEDARLAEGYEMVLYNDFAPYSMGFTLLRPDGTKHLSGGLIFHGNPDQSRSITSDNTIGWQTHT